ncbi:hypothetical protein ASD00_18300 [Ensifer sp. Root31]|uniref:DNA-methyltransferase n=1 Tax=Ensifer sp. Root31 TaxID=1736512 RepID=UPI00070F3D76|nr:site-specific DNA-methyltransferase [Ensifer sp. Root31]KQU96800.1 hypothetical protein ASD00_18300 [Ensifer sp. Root31]
MIDFLDGRVTLHAGDCIEILAAMPENSVDSVVCDPPYHLTSIVKRFGGDMPPRTEATVGKHAYGRHAAGFMGQSWDGGDIAFQVATWQAVQRVLKPGGYILAFASTRGFWRMCVAIEDAGFITHPMIAWVFGSGFPKATRLKAEGYDGWRYGGQALKPAIEPIYMGQKPFGEKTGTANVMLHGTGAVNIDGCRVDGDPAPWGNQTEGNGGYRLHQASVPAEPSEKGRWPANLIHDGSDEVVSAFPEAPGQQMAVGPENGAKTSVNVFGDYGARDQFEPRGDTGSAARFFYSSKADADDRIGSKHPTVKPIDLMRYLCRLVTPPGGVVLDPFAGTGTTGEAAWREGFNAVLIEREPEYQQDIAERMRLCLAGPDEKRREIIKRRGLVEDDAGPLFGGAA